MTKPKTRLIRSMTGQGQACEQSGFGSIQVEVRTVNHRGFKCVSRLSDAMLSLESRIEALVRSKVHRGMVHLSATLRRPPGEDLPNINVMALQRYIEQLRQVRDQNEDVVGKLDVSLLLGLPGIMNSNRESRPEDDGLWEFVRATIVKAIDNLDQMRAIEGHRMAEALAEECRQIRLRLDRIDQLAPCVVDGHRNRLQGKIERILKDHGIQVPPVDLLREVQLYADRVDISEEIVRLGSHLVMFASVLQGGDEPEPTGRKLDFILQEMFRETNTIGSKASDGDISALVVEIKCAIERMRELVQNLE